MGAMPVSGPEPLLAPVAAAEGGPGPLPWRGRAEARCSPETHTCKTTGDNGVAALTPRAPPRAPTRREPARYLAEDGGCLHAPRRAGVHSPTESRRGPAAGRARGPHRCLAASPAATEPVRDRDQPRRRPPPAPSDQEMGRHRKSQLPSGAPPPRLRQLQGPASPPRGVLVPGCPVPLRGVPGCRVPECPVPQLSERPPRHGAARGGAGAQRDGGGARGTLGVVVPHRQRRGCPWGGGDYKSRHAARLWPAGGAVPGGPGRGYGAAPGAGLPLRPVGTGGRLGDSGRGPEGLRPPRREE